MGGAAYQRLTGLDNAFLVYEDDSAAMHVASTQILEAAPLRASDGSIDIDRITDYVVGDIGEQAGERLAGNGKDMPGLQIAARGRETGPVDDLADDSFFDGIRFEGAATDPRGKGFRNLHMCSDGKSWLACVCRQSRRRVNRWRGGPV